MTKIDFLNSIKRFTEEALSDILLPVRAQKAGELPPPRPPTVYRQRMPDMNSSEKKAPYILHQIVTSDDSWPQGGRAESSLLLRSVFCLYYPMEDGDPKEDEGSLQLLEVMERFRIALLENQLLDGRYRLDITTSPLEALIYPDNLRPYYIGEYASNWFLPPVEWSDLNKWRYQY